MKKILYCALLFGLLTACGGEGKKTGNVSGGRTESKEELLGGHTEEELISATIPVKEELPDQNDDTESSAGGVVKSLPNNGKPSILDFTASWCGPCRMMKPVFIDLEDTYDGSMNFVTIDIDLNQEMASRFGVRAVPTFIFLDAEGKVVRRVEGVVEQAVLENQINRMISK
ncbi:MAG: thioredoxin family protein [Muribaculaceae bacterium]|nr:thioredoxin family protein [Muribaculaceae bacterium]